MTTINIIGVVMLIGSVLGYGALFLWVLTADKRKARKEGAETEPQALMQAPRGDFPRGAANIALRRGGGGAGSRTPVQTTIDGAFYILSRCLDFSHLGTTASRGLMSP